MVKKIGGLMVVFLISACSSMTEYERQVADWEPVYCYKSLAAVQCYKEPKHSDSRRLVNFYGPAPREYDAPEPPELSQTRPPKMISTWVKDPEPVPEAYVREAAPQPQALKAPATQTVSADEDVSFMDGIRRALFGKPQLANKPVVATAAPTAPAPAAQPVPPVEAGTL